VELLSQKHVTRIYPGRKEGGVHTYPAKPRRDQEKGVKVWGNLIARLQSFRGRSINLTFSKIEG